MPTGPPARFFPTARTVECRNPGSCPNLSFMSVTCPGECRCVGFVSVGPKPPAWARQPCGAVMGLTKPRSVSPIDDIFQPFGEPRPGDHSRGDAERQPRVVTVNGVDGWFQASSGGQGFPGAEISGVLRMGTTGELQPQAVAPQQTVGARR